MAVKLTEEQIKVLQGCKGVKNGRFKFFDILEDIYKDDSETLEEIKKHREMCEGVDSLAEYPNAYAKTQDMYFDYMDELLNKLGYHK